jgi:hypothetical protein
MTLLLPTGFEARSYKIHIPNESARSAITTIQAAIKEYTAQLQISDKDQNKKIGLTLEEFC